MYYKDMENVITLEGFAAIEYAEAHDLTLNKYNDPTEDSREGLTPDEARAVAREDSHLIYLTLTLSRPDMKTKFYEARMEGASKTITADSLANAMTQAEDWARDGSWDLANRTVWVHAYLIEMDDDGKEIDSHRIKVQIDPEEPDCTQSEHNWQAPVDIVGGIKENPGVWGHGGGVTIQEVCLHCGCGKLIDTWAQDPETGEQGLRSVSYQPGKYAAEVERMRGEEGA